MKQRLRRILSILCFLAMTAGCLAVPAGASEQGTEEPAKTVTRIVVVEWKDENDYDGLRPSEIKMTTAGGASVTVTADDNWIAEAETPEGAGWNEPAVNKYSVESIQLQGPVTTVTCTHNVEKTSLTVKADWQDGENYAGFRPNSVTIHLYADGKLYSTGTAKEAGSWKVQFENLPVYRNGSRAEQKITYSVKADSTPAGYTSSVSESVVTYLLQTGTLTLNITTAGVPDDADISGLTVSADGPDPGVRKTFSAGKNTTVSYSLGSVLPGAYLATIKNADDLIEGYVMDPENTNVGDAVYVEAKGSEELNVCFTWKEAEASEPNENPLENAGSLTFDILGPDPRMPMKGITYAQFTDGKYEVNNLVAGTYVVVERNAEKIVDSFTLSADNSTTGVCINVTDKGATASLVNTYTPLPTPEPDAELIDVPVVKIWNDNNDKDGNRPGSVTVRLYANGVEDDSAVLSAANGWAHTFTDKLRYDDNKEEISYTVKEDAVEWYIAEIRGTYITNTYNPEVTSASVHKVWVDDNNKLQIRPTSIAVTLKPLNEVYVLNEENGWSVVREDLPTRINGQPVTYSWTEQETVGYKLDNVSKTGIATIFTNRVIKVPKIPPEKKQPDIPDGGGWADFNDYDTALGIPLLINHVGDCFD